MSPPVVFSSRFCHSRTRIPPTLLQDNHLHRTTSPPRAITVYSVGLRVGSPRCSVIVLSLASDTASCRVQIFLCIISSAATHVSSYSRQESQDSDSRRQVCSANSHLDVALGRWNSTDLQVAVAPDRPCKALGSLCCTAFRTPGTRESPPGPYRLHLRRHACLIGSV